MRPLANQYRRYRAIFQDEPMPLAFVDLEAFERNLFYVAQWMQSSGKTIRIHSKSLRTPAMIERILKSRPEIFQGVMTYTMAETAFLARLGLDDFIVAYPSVQKSDLALFAALLKEGKTLRLMVDSIAHLDILNAYAKANQVRFPLCLEVDTAYRPLKSKLHLGLRRSPVRRVEEALAVAAHSLRLQNVLIDSLMGYEGHIAGPNDALPDETLKNAAMRALKFASIQDLQKRRQEIVNALKSEGIELKLVNGGGSGSLKSTKLDPSVTEITVGSAFFAPGLFWHYKDVSFMPSAFFALQVVRQPSKRFVTLAGGGYVASGAAGVDKLPKPVYPEGLALLPLEGAGEVQTPLDITNCKERLRLGDPVFFQHAKAGELAERFNEYYLIRDKTIEQKVRTYRGHGFAFL